MFALRLLTVVYSSFAKNLVGKSWIINSLLHVLVCSIALVGSAKYSTTRKNSQRYYTPKHVIRYIYLYSPCSIG